LGLTMLEGLISAVARGGYLIYTQNILYVSNVDMIKYFSMMMVQSMKIYVNIRVRLMVKIG